MMNETAAATYSVGDLRDPRPEDERYPTYEYAIRQAREQSYPDRILGIWRDDDSELVAIAFDGLVYWP